MSGPHLARGRFLQGLGVSAAAVPFILGLDSLYARAAVPAQWAGPILGAADGLAMTAAWDIVRAGDLATVGTPDLSNNDLCVSILNSFGLETQTFGDPRFCHGPLPGLAA